MLNPTTLKQNMGIFRFYSTLAAGLLFALFLGYRLGYYLSAKQQQQLEQAQHTLQNLRTENERLTRELNILGVEMDVERMAAQTAQSHLQQGIQREAELKKQLGFYQKVMAPELTADGFMLEEMLIYPAQSQGYYYFEIVLMQTKKIKRVVKGDIQITLEGSQDDKPTSLNFAELVEPKNTSLAFSFKYFQVLEGQFSLPPDFVPERIQMNAEIFQFKRKKGDLAKTLEWQSVLRSDNAEALFK